MKDNGKDSMAQPNLSMEPLPAAAAAPAAAATPLDVLGDNIGLFTTQVTMTASNKCVMCETAEPLMSHLCHCCYQWLCKGLAATAAMLGRDGHQSHRHS